jgi:phosphoenolpyruvate carboxykinase (GTP)
MKGWRVWTLGDDIAWLHLDEGGKLRAINPESGYFGVVPGTNEKTNKNAYDMITHDTIFTNVATTADNQPWWEGKKNGTPAKDWQGRAYDETAGPAAHPNSRFTVSATNNPSYSALADAPEGVPISAIVFGGRRKQVAPLVYQAKSWEHGVLIGASTASETTAAMVGDVGVVRRDPMAMKPFCGYNFADYWAHWLSFPERSEHLPGIFHVNWFRQNENGDFLWPGFGENLRVLEWIIERCEGRADAEETAIGYLPHSADINTNNLDIQPETLDELLTVDTEQWRAEMASVLEYLESYGDRLPEELKRQQKVIADALDQNLAKAS